MARISCGHCGGTHSSVAEVRTCSLSGAESPTGPTIPTSRSEHSSQPTRQPTTGHTKPVDHRPLASAETSPEQTATELAGPDYLGRSLVVTTANSIPEPWSQAERIEVDGDAPLALIERLHLAWRTRERLVMVWLGGDPENHRADPNPQPFHDLDVSHEIPGERLDFVLTANAIDLRGPKPRFDPLDRALALLADAEPIPRPSVGIGADLRLADGTELLVDGGPLDLDLQQLVEGTRQDGGATATPTGSPCPPIVPRVHLVAGVVRPLRIRTSAAADLAPDQLQAVSHQSGPARILAPAGSGKTRVLTERARHLVTDCDLAGRVVCMVAYNRRAKDEMGIRLGDVAGLEIRTLNSLALALATGSGPFRATRQPGQPPTTIDELEARRLLDRILPGRRRQRLTDQLEPWIDALSACRLGLRDPTEVEQAYGGDVAGFPDVLETYRQELQRRNLLDFDEQIIGAIQRLLDDPEARRVARSVVPMLMIDEFQDLTPAHLLLLRVLAGPAGEVFGVGDDDQTIYGYAGASPAWLIDFERFFPGAADHRLTVNYRCPPEVVTSAVNLLSHNQNRVTKDIKPADDRADALPDGQTGLTILAGDPQTSLVDWVQPLIDDGVEPGQIAVLARVNAALLPAALHLHSVGIPVIRPPGLGPEMLERSGVSAALAWLQLASGPAQNLRSDDLRLALRRPPRSLHPRISDWVCEQRSVGHLRSLAGRLNREKEAESVAGFADDIERLRADVEAGHDTATLLNTVYDVIGLAGAASQLDRSQRSARRAAHADELNALAAVASLQPDPAEFARWLRGQVAELPQHQVGANAVTLATIHTTKGLEWPYVVVHDVRNDLYPHSLATDIEEERRIFHVGVTRGRRAVAITCSGPPSPFVDQLRSARPADEPWPEPTQPASDRGSNRRETPSTKPRRAEPAGPEEAALRDTLTAWRRERSKTDGVPAYVVFDNKTLDAIARTQPTSLIELGAISGIGPAKLERYGADVLGLVASSQSD